MVGSGVIPVALHKGKVYYLFGREGSAERDKNFDWGDFGGGSKPGENVMEITTREGCEELNGFFGDKKDFKKYIMKNKIDEFAYDKRYSYLIKIDYDEKLPYYFNNNYKFIMEYLKPLADHPTNGLFEKSEIRWFTADDLKKNRNIFREYYRHVIDIIVNNDKKTLGKLKRNSKPVKVATRFNYSKSKGQKQKKSVQKTRKNRK